MTNILLISDNPIFIRHACESLEILKEITLNVSLRSSAIFEEYLQYSPDIIILEHTFLLPLSSVLKHFEDYQWECSFISVGAISVAMDMSHNVIFVTETNQLPLAINQLSINNNGNKEDSLIKVVEPISISKLKGNNLPPPDIYYLMLSMSTISQPEPLNPTILKHLQAQITTIGEVDLCTPFQHDILIRMKKSTMHMYGAFSRIHSIVCKTLGADYASIYCEDIPANALSDTLGKITGYAQLRIFFSSRCLDTYQINTIIEQCPQPEAFSLFVKLIKALLYKRPDMIQDTLREWYLSKLKSHFDLKSLQLTIDWQYFFDNTLFKNYLITPRPVKDISSIENEYTKMAQHWDCIFQAYSHTPLLPVVRESVLLLLQKYDDPQISLDYLANALSFSKTYVSRIFKEQLDLTIVDFLQQLRMEYACHLFKMSNDSVKLVAQNVGYPDPQYFSKLFHRNTGVYPTEYRLLNQKE